MSEPEDGQQRNYCPTCGAAYEPLQEYCLECGTRLPTNRGVVGVLASSWQRRFAWYPGDWIWPVLLLLVVAAVATTAALAASSDSKSGAATLRATTPSVTVGPGAAQAAVSPARAVTLPNAPAPTITTGPLPLAPGAPLKGATTTAPTTPAANPNALAFWPSGQSGYTIVLESLPVTNGRSAAVAKARLAKRAGLKNVGVLVTAQYSSLHTGYYAIFSGIYRSAAQAAAGVAAAHADGFPDAYQARVTR